MSWHCMQAFKSMPLAMQAMLTAMVAIHDARSPSGIDQNAYTYTRGLPRSRVHVRVHASANGGDVVKLVNRYLIKA